MKRTIAILIAIAIVGGLAMLFARSFENTTEELPASDKSNIIVVASPIKDSEVSSPLRVAGRAKGSWFFEGSFPITLTDAYGNVIGQSHVTAQGEWMTENFVPFIGDLEFSNYIKGSQGTLILQKDNPSGLPEYDDAITIPVTFK